MINPVNLSPMVQNTTMMAPQQVATQPRQIYAPMDNPNMDGLKALAAYNQPLANSANVAPKTITPTLPTVLTPAAIHSMEGERISSADGTLSAIVKRGENTTTVYKMDIQAPNDAIRTIETYDNKTGKLKAVQKNYNKIEQGKAPVNFSTDIVEYDENGKEKKATYYFEGKLSNVVETQYGPNGFEKRYIAREDGSTAILEDCKVTKTSRYIDYDKNGQVRELEITDHKNNSSKIETYKNGKLVNVENKKQEPIPNTTGKNPQADTQLVPAQPYVLGYDPKQVEGQKQYYSNGAIERITTQTANGSITHTFDVNGTLTGIEDAQDPNNVKYIVYHDYGKCYSVEEKLGENLFKTTNFIDDGSVEVSVMNDNTKQEKIAVYEPNGKLTTYIEHNSPEDKILMGFNESGELIKVL